MTKKLALIAVAIAVPLTAAAETRSAPAPQPAPALMTATVAGFEYGETYVHTKQRHELRKLAKQLKQMPGWSHITIEGHGYVEANEEESIELGQRRADRVKKLLVKYGVDPKYVVAVGHSRGEPGRYVELTIEGCADDSCRR